MKYVFGPVYSWRLGVSLGIDPISVAERAEITGAVIRKSFAFKDKVYNEILSRKTCNFDCIYCQLGRTHYMSIQRKEFVSVRAVLDEISCLPEMEDIDYYTFSGAGEPCLASNLGDMIAGLRPIVGKAKIAVITNSSLLHRPDVQEDLLLSDIVLAKLDACSQELMQVVNNPADNINFESIVDGIAAFKSKFQGRLALQIMFVDENKKYASAISDIARRINPDEVQLNTPLRPSGVSPLLKAEMDEIKLFFKDMNVVSVYDVKKRKIKALSVDATERRHGVMRE